MPLASFARGKKSPHGLSKGFAQRGSFQVQEVARGGKREKDAGHKEGCGGVVDVHGYEAVQELRHEWR
jgi:hypothetical protein